MVDELLLQPQFRDQIEAGFERQRFLRLQLRLCLEMNLDGTALYPDDENSTHNLDTDASASPCAFDTEIGGSDTPFSAAPHTTNSAFLGTGANPNSPHWHSARGRGRGKGRGTGTDMPSQTRAGVSHGCLGPGYNRNSGTRVRQRGRGRGRGRARGCLGAGTTSNGGVRRARAAAAVMRFSTAIGRGGNTLHSDPLTGFRHSSTLALAGLSNADICSHRDRSFPISQSAEYTRSTIPKSGDSEADFEANRTDIINGMDEHDEGYSEIADFEESVRGSDEVDTESEQREEEKESGKPYTDNGGFVTNRPQTRPDWLSNGVCKDDTSPNVSKDSIGYQNSQLQQTQQRQQCQLPQNQQRDVKQKRRHLTLLASMVEAMRGCSMIPLGQDRAYRRYWLVVSLPAVLIEHIGNTETICPTDTSACSPSSFSLITCQPQQTLAAICACTDGPPAQRTASSSFGIIPRIMIAQQPSEVTLGRTPEEAVANIKQALEWLTRNQQQQMQLQIQQQQQLNQHYSIPPPLLSQQQQLIPEVAVDREAALFHLASLPPSPSVPISVLRRLVRPERVRPSELHQHLQHPAVAQVERFRNNPVTWSFLAPVSPTESIHTGISEPPDPSLDSGITSDRLSRAQRTIDRLEATLNQRGARESRLRESIIQLRPLLINAVAACPEHWLTSAEFKPVSMTDLTASSLTEPSSTAVVTLESINSQRTYKASSIKDTPASSHVKAEPTILPHAFESTELLKLDDPKFEDESSTEKNLKISSELSIIPKEELPGSVKIEFCTTKESDESKEPILSVSNPDPPLVRSESDKKSKLQVPTLCTSTLLSSCSITNKCGSDVPSTSQNATSESRHFCTNSAELLLYAWLDAALVGIATRLGRHSYPVRHSNLSSGSAGVRRKFSSSSCSSSSSITSVPPPAPETHSTLSGTPSISDSTPVDSAPDCSSSSKAAISVNTDISSAPLLSPGMNTCPLEATREAEAIETVKSLEIISKINSSDTSIDNSHTVCSDENPVKETAKIEMVVDQKQLIQISGATTNDKISLGSPTLSASENSTLQKSENILSHSHLAELQRRYSDILLSIGKSVGPRALAGPISSEDKTLRSGSSAGAYFWPSAISTGGSGCNASPFTSASHSTTPNIAPNIHDGFSLGSNWTTVSGDPKQVDADSVLAPSDTPLATSSKPLTSDIVGPTSLTNSALDPGAPSTHNMAVAAGSLDVSVDSNGSAVRTTTGWQRWCKHVYEASSPAQLHLLARALERGSRRAAQAGRGVPAAVAAYAARFPLPPLVCTACRLPPDTQIRSCQSAVPTSVTYSATLTIPATTSVLAYSKAPAPTFDGIGTTSVPLDRQSHSALCPGDSGAGPHSSAGITTSSSSTNTSLTTGLSVCAGCACPYHLTCLLEEASVPGLFAEGGDSNIAIGTGVTTTYSSNAILSFNSRRRRSGTLNLSSSAASLAQVSNDANATSLPVSSSCIPSSSPQVSASGMPLPAGGVGGGHFGLASSLGNITSARLEATLGSLMICSTCRHISQISRNLELSMTTSIPIVLPSPALINLLSSGSMGAASVASGNAAFAKVVSPRLAGRKVALATRRFKPSGGKAFGLLESEDAVHPECGASEDSEEKIGQTYSDDVDGAKVDADYDDDVEGDVEAASADAGFVGDYEDEEGMGGVVHGDAAGLSATTSLDNGYSADGMVGHSGLPIEMMGEDGDYEDEEDFNEQEDDFPDNQSRLMADGNLAREFKSRQKFSAAFRGFGRRGRPPTRFMLTHSDKTTLSISSHGKLTRGRGSSARRRRGYGSRRGGSSHGRNGGRQRRRGRRRRVDRDAGSEFDTDEELDDLEYAEVEAEPHSVSGAIYVELEKPFEAASKSTPATAIEGSNGLMGSLARYTGTGAIGKVRLLDPSQTWSGCARMPMASNAVLATTAIEVRTGDISVTPSGVMTRHSLVDQNMIGSDFSASLATKGQVEMEEDEGLASARRVRKVKKAPVITTPTPASSVNIGEAYRSSSGSLGSSTLATNNTAASETTSSTPLCGNELLTQASANRLLAELSSLSAARPLLRCSLGRPSLYRRAELDELDLLSDGDGEGDGNTVNGASSTSIGQDTLSASSTRMGASRRRAALGSDSVDTQSSTTLHRLYAHDLASLQDVLDRRALPGGPSQLIPQLRMLIGHWVVSNRPGSRLHECALGLQRHLEMRLSEMGILPESHSSTPLTTLAGSTGVTETLATTARPTLDTADGSLCTVTKRRRITTLART